MRDALHQSAIQKSKILTRFAGPLILVAAACGSAETTRRTSPEATAGAGGDSTPSAAGAGGDSTPGAAGAGGDSTPGAAGAGGDSTPSAAGAGGDSTPSAAGAGGAQAGPCAAYCQPTGTLELADDGYRAEANRGESHCFELTDSTVGRIVCWENDVDHVRVNGSPVVCLSAAGALIEGGSYCIELEGPTEAINPGETAVGGILVTWPVD